MHTTPLFAPLVTGAGAIKLNPNAGLLPGSKTLQTFVDGLAGWALMLCAAGLVIGAGLWAVGAHSQNYQQSYAGRRAVLVALGAALLIGAAKALINFFFAQGQGVQ